jgi:hypothetical protein
MNTILTAAEIQAKGITMRDVQRLLKKSETRVNSYATQYARNGFKCSDAFQAAWDAECARWDHFKATLEALQ